MYSRETKIEDLYNEKKISRRTLNRLNENRLFDLGQILDYCGNDKAKLSQIAGFGDKGVYEITNIIDQMPKDISKITNIIDKIPKDVYEESSDDVLDEMLDEAYNYALSRSEADVDVLKKNYPSAIDLHKDLLKIADGNLPIHKEYSKEANIRIRMFGLNYARKTINLLEENERANTTFSTIYEKYKSAESRLLSSYEKFTLYEEALFLSNRAEMQELMQLTYEKLVERCLKPSERIYLNKILGTFDKIAYYFDTEEHLSELFGGNPTLSILASLKNICILFKDKFLEYYKLSDYDATLELLKIKFPFLDSGQRKFMCEFMFQKGYVPLFFLIFNYVKTSDVKRNQAISYLYGFYDSLCLEKDEVAEKIGCSSENVRQIDERGIFFGRKTRDSLYSQKSDYLGDKKGEEFYVNEMITSENLSHYEELFCQPYITSYSPIYQMIKKQEHLDCGFGGFAKILIALNKKFSIYDKFKEELLLINSSLSIDNVSKIRDNIETIFSKRYWKDTIISYEEFIDAKEDLDVEIISLIKDIAQDFYKLTVSAKGILMPKTYTDISEELYLLLKEKNAPMSLEELFKAFKNKYPDYNKYTDPGQIRPFLYNDKNKGRIRPKGKTSTYVLSESGQNTDTIRGILRKLLQNSDMPIKISELYTEVSKHYPTTNEKSIVSSMQKDESGCFVEFENGFWGLKDKFYPPTFKPRETYKREKFSDRIKEFKKFVDQYHRFPTGGPMADQRESSLYRWYYNITRGIIKLPDNEKMEFDAMIKFYEQCSYPQNAVEYEFLNTCKEMKDYIQSHHSLPTRDSDERLYNWYYKAKRNFDGYIDQRKKYLDDLFDFIKSFGFEVFVNNKDEIMATEEMKNEQEGLSTWVMDEDYDNAVKDEYGVFYSGDGKRLLSCENKELKDYAVREGTEIICDLAFMEVYDIDDEDEGEEYLYKPSVLTSVKLPNSLTTIGSWSFIGRYNLTTIELPEGLTSIGKSAFFQCDNVETVYIRCSADADEAAIIEKFKKLLPEALHDKIEVVRR